MSEKGNNQLYLEREKRVQDAVSLKKPDRVPIVTTTEFFFVRDAGLTAEEAMYDYEKMAKGWKQSMQRYQWDMAPLQHAIRPGPVMELMGMKIFKWPGYDLNKNSIYQWVEKEYMLPDEYDEFLKNPSDFTIRKILPRMSRIFEPLAMLPPITSMVMGYTILSLGATIAGIPEVVAMMDQLKRVGEENAKWNAVQAQLSADIKEMGYPVLVGGLTLTAFDWVSDCLRGMKGSMMDMYRRPDRLKAAVEMLEPLSIQLGILSAKKSGNNRVYIPLHRGAAGFMSDEQFETFYWPSLKRLLLALLDAGCVPMPFFEGDYTPRLKYLAELPKGKIMGKFDKMDRKKFKEVLGDTMCFWGNVPGALLCTGTEDQVRDDVKQLIDIFGDTGGLIIDTGSTGPPPESRRENVVAMTETVFEYGKFF